MSAPQILAFHSRMLDLYAKGDAETRSALKLFNKPIFRYADALDARAAEGGRSSREALSLLEANSRFQSAVDDFAERCALVGSTTARQPRNRATTPQHPGARHTERQVADPK